MMQKLDKKNQNGKEYKSQYCRIIKENLKTIGGRIGFCLSVIIILSLWGLLSCILLFLYFLSQTDFQTDFQIDFQNDSQARFLLFFGGAIYFFTIFSTLFCTWICSSIGREAQEIYF